MRFLLTGAIMAVLAFPVHAGTPADVRAAVTAVRSGDALAEARLLEAVMADRPVVTERATRSLPKYHMSGDIVPPHAIMASDASKVIVMHNAHGLVTEVFDVATGQSLRKVSDLPWWTGFSADLSTVARSSGEPAGEPAGEEVWLEDLVSGERLKRLSGLDDNQFVVIANDRRWMAVAFRDSLRIHDLTAASGTYAELSGKGAFDEAIVSPDGRTVVAAVPDAGYTDFRRQVWDVAAREVRITIESNGATRDVFTQDGRYLVSSRIAGAARDGNGWDWRVTIRDMKTFAVVGAPLIMKDVSQAQVLPGGHLLALNTWGKLQILDLRSHRLIGQAAEISVFSRTGWRADAMVTIDGDHVMHSYAPDPALGLHGEALIAEACRVVSGAC